MFSFRLQDDRVDTWGFLLRNDEVFFPKFVLINIGFIGCFFNDLNLSSNRDPVLIKPTLIDIDELSLLLCFSCKFVNGRRISVF